jgi:MFS family permease
MIVGTALTTIPASMLMRRVGRRNGFSFAAVLSSVAALAAAWALANANFLSFCVAAAVFGSSLAFVQQYRFAAAESVAPRHAGRAISLVLLGAIGGAVVGPELANRGRHAWELPEYVGSMLALAMLLAIAAVLLRWLREPAVGEAAGDIAAPRPLRAIVRQPVYIVAVLGGVTGYGVMTFIMTATPISMHVLDGHDMQATASVIRSHVIAMYAPSLVSGYLIERLGSGRMMLAGAVLMLVTISVGLLGHAYIHYWAALVVLGIGWNFLYVGGTTLLTRTYRSSERFKAQSINDFSVFTMSALGSLLSGTIIQLFGWSTVVITALPPLLLVMIALYLVLLRRGARVPVLD